MNEIFKAIYDRLTASLSETVYDHVPQNLNDNNYPYVKITPLELENNDSDTENAFTATFKVLSFSRYRGTKEINDLSDEIFDSLHNFAFADTTTYGVSGCYQSSSVVTMLDDGLTRMSAQIFKINYEPLPL
jgi:hypothetical protein